MAGKTRRDRVIDAMLALAAEGPWRRVTLAAVAEQAGVSLGDLRREFRSLDRIVMGFLDRIDEEMLAGGEPPDPADTVRDRVFDLIMRRLDALGPHKPALRSLVAGLGHEPGTALKVLARLFEAQRWVLEAAGGNARGLRGRMRVKGLAMVYARTFRVWLDEDDPGHARTMATLDRALRRGERWAGRLEGPVVFAEGVACLAATLVSGGRRRPGPAPAANGNAAPSEA